MKYVVQNIMQVKETTKLEIIINEKISNLIKKDLLDVGNCITISSTAQ